MERETLSRGPRQRLVAPVLGLRAADRGVVPPLMVDVPLARSAGGAERQGPGRPPPVRPEVPRPSGAGEDGLEALCLRVPRVQRRPLRHPLRPALCPAAPAVESRWEG